MEWFGIAALLLLLCYSAYPGKVKRLEMKVKRLEKKQRGETYMATITATAIVREVQNFVKLSDEEVTKILADNQEKLNLSEKQKVRWHKKCLCLVEFGNVEKISPLAFDHQGNMDDWLIIEKIEDVVIGTSVPYNYDKSKF